MYGTRHVIWCEVMQVRSSKVNVEQVSFLRLCISRRFSFGYASDNSCRARFEAKMLKPSEEVLNLTVWAALSWENRDIRADALPMMNSYIWPIGMWKIEPISTLFLSFQSSVVGIMHCVSTVYGYQAHFEFISVR